MTTQDQVSAVSDAIRSRVDRILCLTCPQGFASRYPSLTAEFVRYGLGDLVVPVINVYSAVEHAELNRRRFANPGAAATNVKNCAMGHYHMVQFAIDSGYRRAMFVEDDCRFSAAADLPRYLSSMPEGSSLLGHAGLRGSGADRVFPDFGWPRWGVLNADLQVDLATCYVLDRDGMRAVAQYYESAGTGVDTPPMDAADRVWPHVASTVALHIPRVSLFVQSGGVSLIHGSKNIVAGQEVI